MSMSMKKLLNVSSSPHARSALTTGRVMRQVILALTPAACVGVYRFGLHALLVIAVAVASAVLTEYVFDRVAKRPDTIRDGSAVVTGLLLALCLPARVPLYIPLLGSFFAILFAKCFFGGLGRNFMNPALAGRCFLLLSFAGVMSDYSVDGVSRATPLAELAAGEEIHLAETLLGISGGVIGCSVLALALGGVYLWAVGVISLEIPASVLVSFLIFLTLFGGKGFDPTFLAAHLAGGGIVMGALFMATDPVTSPVTAAGQILFGVLIGVLSGIFRVFGNTADSVSYAIVIANMTVPLLDEISVPLPYGLRKRRAKGQAFPAAALALGVITLAAGAGLSGVYKLTEERIAEQREAAKAASYREVCPQAEEFFADAALAAAVEAVAGEDYGTEFGRVRVNDAVMGQDSAGQTVGCVISVTSKDGVEGDITLSVGIESDGTVNGIAFTEMNETAGLGSLCAEAPFKDQFRGVKTEAFLLNKAGGSTADYEIDSVSGASVSSGAIVNAVNAALDFFAVNIQQGGQ